MTLAVKVATLSAPGVGDPVELHGAFNFTLSGSFAGSVIIERSFDGGTLWHPVADAYGSTLKFSEPCSLSGFEPECNVLYRARATEMSTGAAQVRLSQSQ